MELLSVQTLRASYASTCATLRDHLRDQTHQRYHRLGHDRGHHRPRDDLVQTRYWAQHPVHHLDEIHRHLDGRQLLHPCGRHLGHLVVRRGRLDADRHRRPVEVNPGEVLPDAEFHSTTVAECSCPEHSRTGYSLDAEHRGAACPEWMQRGCFPGAGRRGVGSQNCHRLQATLRGSTLLRLALALRGPEPLVQRELAFQQREGPSARGREPASPWQEPLWALLPAQVPSHHLPQGRPSACAQPGVQRWRTAL